MALIMVTGAAGFIGYHVASRLLANGHEVHGIDNLNSYYDVELKRARLSRLSPDKNFRFTQLDVADEKGLGRLFDESRFDAIVHLAAQAGVRYSLEHPDVYVRSNLVGFANMLQACRSHGVGHFVFASSSSVYGANRHMPFSTADHTDHPISLYAATKKSNEVMAHSYAHLFGIPTTGIRFFTVYGPWGRPDMAIYSFARAICRGGTIDLFNGGQMKRDFTYVEDAADAVARIVAKPPASDEKWDAMRPDPSSSSAPFRIYNLGHSDPVDVRRVLQLLEQHLGRKAVVRMLPVQPGDVPATFADISSLERDFGFRPTTSIETGIRAFVEWFLEHEVAPRCVAA
jgi:UDP-glucuronate 4-epimerase